MEAYKTRATQLTSPAGDFPRTIWSAISGGGFEVLASPAPPPQGGWSVPRPPPLSLVKSRVGGGQVSRLHG